MLNECVVSPEKLNILLVEWIDRLRLQEWNIVVDIYREKDFICEDSVGENSFNKSNAKSIIRILDPCDYSENTRFPQNMEKTLVHELLHLKFCYFEPEDENSLEHDMWERTIETLAETLVKTKYEQVKREK